MFGKQFANVVEWEEFDENMLFWKWSNREIKRGSKLILRPGQAAVFMYNGAVEGTFDRDGTYDIESEIIPFLSTLKGFKFGFNSGMRAEVVFINKKEIQANWGTKQPINLPANASMPGGLPIRANGSYVIKIDDYMKLIDNVVGSSGRYTMDELSERILNKLEPCMISAIAKNGVDLFNIQANSMEIAKGIRDSLQVDLVKSGIYLIDFSIRQVSYPKEIQSRINQAAGNNMLGDLNRNAQVKMADGMGNGGTGSQMAEMMMGMTVAQTMVNNMNNTSNSLTGSASPKFCPECGTPTNGAKFCPNCGKKLV